MGKGYCGEEQCTHTYTRVKLLDWHYMSSSVAHFLVDRVSLNLEFQTQLQAGRQAPGILFPSP